MIGILVVKQRFFWIFQEMEDVYVGAEMYSDKTSQVSHRPSFYFAYAGLNDFDKHICYKSTPQLYPYGIFVVA